MGGPRRPVTRRGRFSSEALLGRRLKKKKELNPRDQHVVGTTCSESYVYKSKGPLAQTQTSQATHPEISPVHQTETLARLLKSPSSMGATSPDSGDLILVEPARPGSPVVVVTINRPAALNALTRPMMISLAAAFRRLDADDGVAAAVLAGRGRAFCSGVDLTAAEEVFKGDVKDPAANPVAQMELCRKPIVGAVAGFAVTAGFEIALACDLLVAGRSAKFLDTHAKFGIFPSWGLSQKLSRVIGPNRAREVSLTCMPITAEMAEKWGLVNHIVDDNQVLSKAIEVAEAIARNNRNLVVLYKSVINDGLQLDMEHARALEKERAHNFYNGMTKEQFANMQKFIQGRSSKAPSKL